jgi:putative acetyltransferase
VGLGIEEAKMQIRPFCDTDLTQIVQLFFNTVHMVNRQDYTLEQVNAWVATVPSEAVWAERYQTRRVFVADHGGTIAGFAELEPSGHIDCFYCHADYQRQGVGRALYKRLEEEAIGLELTRLWVEASITAKPFFEQMGFQALHENRIIRNQVALINYSMEKSFL